MNLEFLKREYTIGLNKIFLGFESFHFHPRYYVAVNPSVLSQSADIIRSTRCVKFIGSHGHRFINEDALTYHVNSDESGMGAEGGFSKDIERCVYEGWTVTYVALQIAFYMGFQQVVIVGMDHSYETDGAPNQSVIRSGPDNNHFHPDYFASGQAWDNPDLEQSEISYRYAKKAFQAEGREIVDATFGGFCNIFDKRDYRDVFGLPHRV